MKDKKRSVLLTNTVMLYILTFSNYLFSFITVPYQTRVLGPEIYGELGFASSVMTYVQLFLDFGFLLSATEDVSRRRDDKGAVSQIMSAVFVCKILLGLVSLVVVTGMCLGIERFRADALIYMLFFLSTMASVFLPDFVYRGMEKMSAITIRTVAVRLFFTCAIFVFMKTKEQAYMIPLLNALGGVGACVWAYYDVRRRMEVRFVKVSWRYVLKTLRRSASYFLSRIASSVYGATNSLIVGMAYPNSATLGCYTTAEKLTTTANRAFSPIADSLYPYMVRNKDFRLVKRILWLLMPPIVIGCTVVGIFAQELCVFVFGAEYAQAGHILRCLMPVVITTLPSYIFGFPVLTPLGMGKYANSSVVIGAVWHGVSLLVLFALGALTVESVCIATCVTESVVLAIRVVMAMRGMKKLKLEQAEG